MPPEWRLTYYNTQFSCVFMPTEDWHQKTTDVLQTWADDTHEAFLFLLEANADTDTDSALPVSLLDRTWKVHASDPRLVWFDAATNLQSLAACLSSLPPGEWCVVGRDGDLAQIERVRTLLDLLGLSA